MLALNGGVGDFSIYRQLQVHECYATAAPMKLSAALLGAAGGDCLEQTGHGAETLTNPEPGFFILGAKSYGRNSQFLMRIGWEQVDDVFGSLITWRKLTHRRLHGGEDQQAGGLLQRALPQGARRDRCEVVRARRDRARAQRR